MSESHGGRRLTVGRWLTAGRVGPRGRVGQRNRPPWGSVAGGRGLLAGNGDGEDRDREGEECDDDGGCIDLVDDFHFVLRVEGDFRPPRLRDYFTQRFL